jgi:uncharacterized protein (DUF1778 family)
MTKPTGKPVGRPSREIKLAGVALRLEPDELAVIDAARGDASRNAWIVSAALEKASARTKA